MKLVVRIILAAMLVCLPCGAGAQDVITGPRKPKKQTTAPAKKTPKKQPKKQTPSKASSQAPLTPNEMCAKGLNESFRNNYSEALKWLRKSAELGDAQGQVEYGNMFEWGKGVEVDFSEARRWYQKAADQGYEMGTKHLKWLAEGTTLKRIYIWGANAFNEGNYSEALKWIRPAAREGSADAQCLLGYMYERGLGVAEDMSEALKWYRKASEQGNDTARKNLEIIGGR